MRAATLLWAIGAVVYGGRTAAIAADDTSAPPAPAAVSVAPNTLLSPGDSGRLSLDPADAVSGKPSLLGDSRSSEAEWNEFVHSKLGLFANPNAAYRVSFDYRVIARDGDASFYALVRRPGRSGNTGWTEWRGEPGATGHAEVVFKTRGATDWTLIVGAHRKGAVAIGNVVVTATPTPPPAVLPAPARTWKSPGGATYYVDSAHGDDAADGKSAAQAWRSLDRVNAGTFGPRDRILLRAGSRWSGFLAPGGSGTAGKPIVLGRYGDGPKPAVDAAGKYLATLYLSNVEHWEVADLDIANKGAQPEPRLAGVLLSERDFGTAHHLVLRRLDIHDVTGSNVKEEGGGAGISCTSGGARVKSRYDGLLIEDCHLTRTDRNGITMDGYWSRADWFPSLHVVIRGNLLEDIGGDGIVPIACDGAVVEFNVLRGGRMRAEDYAAGIWPWSCDGTIVQYNEVSGMRGLKDGQGFDSDWNCRGSLFQYNYSHDNDGGFLLICCDGTASKTSSAGNMGTIVRYNVSQNDGRDRLFVITGPCRNVAIYNNTFYVGEGRTVKMVEPGDWGGDFAEDVRFTNNVFLIAGKATFDLGGIRKTVFTNNLYWGDIAGRPADPRVLVADPKLAAPGKAGGGLDAMKAAYRPLKGSPCLKAGILVPFDGRPDLTRTNPTEDGGDLGAIPGI